MPLMSGKSKEAFKRNIGTEMDAGKPQDQALAIAYAMKRRANKMAKGGVITSPEEWYEAKRKNEAQAKNVAERLQARKNENKDHPLVGARVIRNQDEQSGHIKEVLHAANDRKAFGIKWGHQSEPTNMVHETNLNKTFRLEDDDEDTHKMAEGGMVDDDYEDMDEGEDHESYEENEEDEMPMFHLAHPSFAAMIMKSNRDESDEENEESEGYDEAEDEDFLSDEEQDPYTYHNDFDEFETPPKKRGILPYALESMRKRNMSYRE